MNKKLLLATLILAAAVAGNSSRALAATNPDAYSPQDVLIGATPAVQAEGNNGAGVTFGDIDTGITPQWVGFNSQYNSALAPGTSNINTSASAVCMYGVCPTGAFPTDQNGHGTFTASEIVGGIPSIGMEGIDPAGKMIAVQVLSANGSGYSNDVANGIVYAVNHGAEVLNLSLGPGGTAAQQAAFYQSLASAVNYATSKGAVIVFAGGNSSQPLAGGSNITGFTDQAISHLIFMGSTNASKNLSYFSNTPGNGGFVSTSGKFHAYDTMWMMADGENIWGASNYHSWWYGYSYITQMSGTSMAAPQGTGAAGLLLAKWPFLLNTGTIPAILEQTAQDLGSKGTDTTYGDGFLNVAAALAPASPLSVPVGGKMVPVSNTQVVSGRAFGNMSKVAGAFSNAVGYDSFMRGFPITLASAISAPSPAFSAQSASSKVMGPNGGNARSMTDLGNGNWVTSSFANAPEASTDTSLAPTFGPASLPQTHEWSVGFSQGGSYLGYGQGSGAALSYNDARWGSHTAFFNNDVSGTGDLLGLVSDGNFAAIGMNTGADSRVSFGIVNSVNDTLSQLANQGASARGAVFGYTYSPDKNWKLSATAAVLDETNMLLSSTSSGGLLALPPSASTASVGFGANVALGGGYQLGFDTAVMSTSPTNNGSSLINGTSNIASASFGVAFDKQDLISGGDALDLSFKSPMRAYAGSASISVPTGTDMNGNPIVQQERVSLAPTGNELDFGVGYSHPLADNAAMAGLSLVYRRDADNIAGASDAAFMTHFAMPF